MICTGTHAESSPIRFPPLSETEYSVLWKIPLSGPRPCPEIRNVFFLMVTEKIIVWDLFKRLKIQTSYKVYKVLLVLLLLNVTIQLYMTDISNLA